jgi:short-subunit dehydrogenase
MNKIALITGGSSGLGLAMAKLFYKKGYSLILIARDMEKLKHTKAHIERNNQENKVHIYSCDISKELQLENTFKEIKIKHSFIDFLVLNAGITTIDLLADYKNLTDVNKTVRVNLIGPISTTYLSLPLLRKEAHILFVSSGFALVGSAGYSLYAASKAGLNIFADALRRELMRDTIHVHLACPGDIDTPMLRNEHKIMPDWIKHQMGRVKPMKAEKIANYLLDQCLKKQHMIIPSFDVKVLVLVQKLLPRKLSTFIIDHVLPLPPKYVETKNSKRPSFSNISRN